MSNKYKDFDQMFAEMKVETIPFKAFGKVYQIRKEIPAVVVLNMARLEDGQSLPNRLIFEAAEQIFGRDTLNEFCAQPGLSADKLSAMMRWAFEAINGVEDSEPEALTEDDIGAKPSKN